MLGLGALRVGDLTLSVLKLGVVLALATNWPTYQQLVFDTLFRGPAQISTAICQSIIPGRGFAGPFDGLQTPFDRSAKCGGVFWLHSGPTAGLALERRNAFAGASLNLAAF